MDSTRQLDVLDDEPASGSHGYGVNIICLFLRLVMSGVSLRGVPRVLAIQAEAFGWCIDIPHWTTGRLWLMRLGHAMLTQPLEVADDWAWLADHSVQIGQDKCLAILGIRLCDLPEPGQCLQHRDMHLIALVPRASWTGPEVDKELEKAVSRTGVPRAIVTDHGADLHGGVRLFQERHRQTTEIYDIKHKAACLVKKRLEKDVRWSEFQRQVGQTRCAVRQTEVAFLAPPAPKSKARFMNLQPQLEWAEGVLDILRSPPAKVLEWASQERLREKLGWLVAFEDAVSEWSQWQQVVNIAVAHVDRHGISRTTAKEMYREMPRLLGHASTTALLTELVCFVGGQGKQTKRGERLPGSTEVLESCFGKMKELEKQQSRGGFTSLVVSFGAMLADTTGKVVAAALDHSGTKDVYRWCKDYLGTTLFGKRKRAFAESATKG
jgi:hypothetical protein